MQVNKHGVKGFKIWSQYHDTWHTLHINTISDRGNLATEDVEFVCFVSHKDRAAARDPGYLARALRDALEESGLCELRKSTMRKMIAADIEHPRLRAHDHRYWPTAFEPPIRETVEISSYDIYDGPQEIIRTHRKLLRWDGEDTDITIGKYYEIDEDGDFWDDVGELRGSELGEWA